jgi:hypothetical protein
VSESERETSYSLVIHAPVADNLVRPRPKYGQIY